MRRGEIWTGAAGKGYAGKPRPVVIVQDERLSIDSITTCGFTSDDTEAPLLHLLVMPSAKNGLREPSRVMVDKIMTVPRAKLRYRIGRLDDGDMLRLERAMMTFLGLTG